MVGEEQHEHDLDALQEARRAMRNSASMMQIPVLSQVGLALGCAAVVLQIGLEPPLSYAVGLLGGALVLWLTYRLTRQGVVSEGWRRPLLATLNVAGIVGFLGLYISALTVESLNSQMLPIAIMAMATFIWLVLIQRVWIWAYRALV